MDVKINHVAIILDGNGRWATSRGLKRSLGHKAGFNNLKKLSNNIDFNEVTKEMAVNCVLIIWISFFYLQPYFFIIE